MPAGKTRMMRVSHDYHRGGALAYLAAYDIHRAKIYGRCEATTGIEPFTALVTQVMTQEPYASADRVFWVVDKPFKWKFDTTELAHLLDRLDRHQQGPDIREHLTHGRRIPDELTNLTTKPSWFFVICPGSRRRRYPLTFYVPCRPRTFPGSLGA